MAETNIGKITQIIGAVLDIKFTEGKLPAINEAIRITRKDGEVLVVEVCFYQCSIKKARYILWYD